MHGTKAYRRGNRPSHPKQYIPARALVLSLFIMLSLPALIPIMPGGAETVTKFSDGKIAATLEFDTTGSETVSVVLPNDVKVTSASLDILAEERSPGDGYPSDIELDVGEDGTNEWGFGGTGVGYLGYQPYLKDGTTSKEVTFSGSGGTDTSSRILLPRSASITDAYLGVAGNGSSYYPIEGPVMKGMNSNEHFGYIVKNVGDVNDDGWDDTVVGAVDGNRAELYHGGPTFDNQADLVMSGGQYFGQAIAGLGDINDDDVDDFAIAENGTVRVYFGGAGLDSMSDLNLTGEALGIHYFGYSLAGGSDLDDDGYPDIVVGDPTNDLDWKGKVYIFNGGPTLDATWDHRLEGSIGVRFGHNVETGGDLDNDGIDDLAVSVPCCFWWFTPGQVWIFKGGAGFGGSPMATIMDTTNQGYFGWSIAIDDDLNGDGKDDLMVGAPGNGSGKVHMFWGRGTWSSNPSPSWTFAGENFGDQFGYSVSFVGDVNDDGRAEILVGANTYDDPGKDNIGKTYFINGTGTPSIGGAIEYLGTQTGANGGSWVEGVGDLNGDGDLDFTISSWNDNSGRGCAEVFYGSYGLHDPVIKVGGVEMVPVHDGPLFNGSDGSFLLVSELQDVVEQTPGTYTDIYGNDFVDLQVWLQASGPGTLSLTWISINYSLDTSSIMELEGSFNEYLVTARQVGTPGEDVSVPISIGVGSKGRLVLSDLDVEYTPNGIPFAIIDSAEPKEVEIGNPIYLEGHGIDDGTIVSYEWTSDLDGPLGDSANIQVTLDQLGLHTISFRVQDDKGRWSFPNTTTINVVDRNLPPIVTIIDPIIGMEVSGEITMIGNASDPNIGDLLTVEIDIDGKGWEEATDVAPWTFEWNAANETAGKHIISARATDGELYSPVVTINVTVIHPLPGVEITPSSTIEAYPGGEVEVTFHVHNTGTGTGTFTLVPGTKPTMTVGLTTRTVTLEAGEGIDVEVTVHLDLKVSPGTVVLVDLGAKDVVDPLISDMATVRIEIIERPPDPSAQSVVIDPPSDGAGRAEDIVTYEFSVRNKGTALDSYELTAVSSEGWKVTMVVDGSPYVNRIRIEPGSKVTLEVNVEIPKGAKKGTIDDMTLTVQSKNFPSVSADKVVQTKVLPPVKGDTYVVSVPWVPVSAVVISFATLGAVLGGTEWGKYGWFWLFIPMYSRLKKEMVLDNFKRGEINGFIKLNPGTYYNEIKKHLGVSNGVLTYHLNKLEKEGYIRSKVSGRYKHYFPADMKLPNKIVILNELQRGLLKFIRESGAVTQAQVSGYFDIPVPTVSRHMRRLMDADMIAVERKGNLNYYSLMPNGVDMAGEYHQYDEDVYARVPPEPPTY